MWLLVSSANEHGIDSHMRNAAEILTKVRSIQDPNLALLMQKIQDMLNSASDISDIVGIAQGDSPDAALATFLLGIDNPNKHASTLLNILCSTPQENTRREAANALAKCNEDPQLAEIYQLLSCTDLNVRAEALYALSGSAPLLAQPIVTSLLETDPSPQVRSYAAETLSQIALRRNRRRIGFSNAISALMRACRDPDPCVRYSAVSALGRLGSRRPLRLLMEISKSDDAICPEFGALSEGAKMAIRQIRHANRSNA